MNTKDILTYGTVAVVLASGIILSILGNHPAAPTTNSIPSDTISEYELEFYGNYNETLLEDEDITAVEIDDRVAFALQREKPVFVLDSTNVVSLITEMEGWRSKAYRCPRGVLTIGHGITSMGVKEVNRLLGTKYKRVREGDRITKDESIKFMMDYCKCADTYFKKNYKGWRQVLPYVKTSIMSYCYQRGWYGFCEKVCPSNPKAVAKALNEGDNDKLIELMEKYTLNDGYTNRRTAELKNAKKIYNTMYYAALKDWKINKMLMDIKF